MNNRAKTGLSLLAAALFTVASSASAAPTPQQRADALMKEGAALDKDGKPEAALGKFEEAYALVPTGTVAYQIGREESVLGRHALALQHFREALRDPKLPTDARRDAETQIDVLKTKIGVLTLDVPEGVTTTLDGNEVDPKQPAEVPPGLHVVKIRLAAETRSQDVVASAGVVTPVRLRFDAAPPPAAPTPPPPVEPPPSSPPPAHHLWGWPPPKLVTVAAGAVIGAGLWTGSLIAFAGADKPSAPSPSACVNTSAPGCSDLISKRQSYDHARTASTVLFWSGAVVLAATVVTALVWPNEDAPKSAGTDFVVRF